MSDAFIALILEKGYEAVTVQEIIDRANVGRSTFYAHFESKERKVVTLPKKLPVHLTYATAWSGEGGTVNFRSDVYERDLALYEALF